MRALTLTLAGAAALAVVVGMGTMQEKPKNPQAATAGDGAAPATIESFAFLAGAWRSTAASGITEEVWSAPAGNNLIGAFRWLRPDGTPSMLEMLAITREADAVRLRLRHYSATLTAQEEKDKPITLKLAKVEGARAEFVAEKDAGSLAGVNYEVKGGELLIDVLFVAPEGGEKPREPLKFVLKKQ